MKGGLVERRAINATAFAPGLELLVTRPRKGEVSDTFDHVEVWLRGQILSNDASVRPIRNVVVIRRRPKLDGHFDVRETRISDSCPCSCVAYRPLRCASVPSQHRNLGYGLQFATARSVAGEDRHAVLDGLHEAGECMDVGRNRNFAF